MRRFGSWGLSLNRTEFQSGYVKNQLEIPAGYGGAAYDAFEEKVEASGGMQESSPLFLNT